MSEFLIAIHDFTRRTADEITLRKGDHIEVLETDEGFSDGWYMGRNLSTDESGLFPHVYTASTEPPIKIIQTHYSDSQHTNQEQRQSQSSQHSRQPQQHSTIYEAFDDIENALSGLGPIPQEQEEDDDDHDEVEEEVGDELGFVPSWSAFDVAQYMRKTGFESQVCDKFIEHKITGNILLELELSHLKELEIASFGTRFELNKEIERSLDIQQEFGHKQSIPSFDKNWQLPQSPKSSESFVASEVSPLVPSYRASVSTTSEATEPEGQFNEGAEIPTFSSEGYSRESLISNESSFEEFAKQKSASIELRHSYFGDTNVRRYHSAETSSGTVIGPLNLEISPKSDRRVSVLPPNGNLNGQSRSSVLFRGNNSQSLSEADSSRTITEPVNRLSNSSPVSRRSTTSVSTATAVQNSFASSTFKPKKQIKQNTSAFQEGIQQITPTESAANADNSGWMSKRGSGGVGTWRTRYFVLHGTRLSYFSSKTDSREKGLIDITAHRVVPIKANEDKLVALYAASTGSGRYCFKLIPPAPGSRKGVTFTEPRVHYFAVDTREDLRSWMSALMRATIDRDDSVPVVSSCTTPTVSLARARELDALAREARAEELRMAGPRDGAESISTVSTPDLSISRDSENSEPQSESIHDNITGLRGLSLSEGGKINIEQH
ncbi:hypothetical protein V1514DRAFT_281750 [Lipomyces japonicus]|uniref:uncharacterized protein n=1 Tax=Lipomyces japonicus TaxID=56871 RepID=UPI0034CF3927